MSFRHVFREVFVAKVNLARWDLVLFILLFGAILGAGAWMYLHNGRVIEAVAAMVSVSSALAFVWLLFIKTWYFIFKSLD